MRPMLSLMLACAVMTAGCGLRGPLYLPDGPAGEQQAAQPAPAGDAASEAGPGTTSEARQRERAATDPAAAQAPAAN